MFIRKIFNVLILALCLSGMKFDWSAAALQLDDRSCEYKTPDKFTKLAAETLTQLTFALFLSIVLSKD